MSQPIQASTLLPGTVIADRLVVQRCIGAGGLGEVYEVLHKFTKHRRAVKVLHAIFRRDTELVDRFLREASAAGRIGNPHIVETFDAGYLDDGSPFIVMEFLEGKSLKEVLRRHGRFDSGLAASVVSQVCTAIQAAHDAGIIHRDLKPENLFLTERDGRAFVKVVDFGISKFQADEGEALGSTRSGITMGTPRYMAPEQLRSAKNADVRSDVYSLGVVLYELVSGAVPFEADSFVELAMRVLGGQHRPLCVLDDAIPQELSSIVEKAMRLLPEERFQSARALREALSPFACNQSVSMLLGLTGEEGEAPPRELASQSALGTLATPVPARLVPTVEHLSALAPLPARSSILSPLDDVLSERGTPSSDGPPRDEVPVPSELGPDGSVEPEAGPRRSGRLWTFAPVLGLALVLLAGLGVFAWRHGQVSSAQTALSDRPSRDLPPVEDEAVTTAQEPSIPSGLSSSVLPDSGPPAPVVPPPVAAEAASPSSPSLTPPAEPVVLRPPVKKAPKKERVKAPAAIEMPRTHIEAPPVPVPVPMVQGAPSPVLGVVDIACQPVPCTVTVDGKLLGETPLLKRSLPVGQHKAVLINSETGASETRTFEVTATGRTKLIVVF